MHYLCLQLEDIKLYLMNRFQQNRHRILKLESELCPKVCKRLHREKMGSGRWLACWTFNTMFNVKNSLQSFIMDLAKRMCSCRKWDITVSHAAMQFHTYSSTKRQLRSTPMTATKSAHTQFAISP